MPAADQRRLLLAVARGQTDWREIERLGVTPALDRRPPEWIEPAALPITAVSPADLATGFLTHLPSSRGLQEWAQAIEMCGCFDLASLEDDPVGELLLDALWSASYGEPIAVDSVEAIRSIAEGSSAEVPEPRPAVVPAARRATPRRP